MPLLAKETRMWSRGQPWRTVRSLDRLNEQIRAAHPRAVPPATPAASWGSIADSAHSSTSDHYPHFYSALGATAVVCARDFPHAPNLGLDAHKVAEQLRTSRDPRIGYIISNGRITGPNYRWAWAAYSGSDPHDTHIHVSTVHTAAADSGADWQIGEDDDMPTAKEIADALLAADLSYTGSGALPLRTLLRNLHQQQRGPAFGDWQASKDTAAVKAQLAALTAAVGKLPGLVGAEGTSPTELAAALAALPNRGDVDEQQIVAGVLAGLTPEKIAAAIPAELAGQVADELAARLAG